MKDNKMSASNLVKVCPGRTAAAVTHFWGQGGKTLVLDRIVELKKRKAEDEAGSSSKRARRE